MYESHRSEVMARRRAESSGETSGFLEVTSSWFSGKESHRQWTEVWGIRNKVVDTARTSSWNTYDKYVWGWGSQNYARTLRYLISIDTAELYFFILVIVTVVLLLSPGKHRLVSYLF